MSVSARTSSARLEAFSDGVMAIAITIIVFEFKLPGDATLEALKPLAPLLFAYMLSFCQIGIFWNNHHHLLRLTTGITPKLMWRNLVFLFFISLTPFVTLWLGEHFDTALPTALFGMNALACGLAYRGLQNAVLQDYSKHALDTSGLGDDKKGLTSLLLYALAVPLAFVNHWLAIVLYAAVAVLWFIPDRRVQTVLSSDT